MLLFYPQCLAIAATDKGAAMMVQKYKNFTNREHLERKKNGMTNGESRKPFRHDRQRKGSQCIVGKKHRRTRNAGRKLMTTQIVILIVFTMRTYKSDEDMTFSSTLPFLQCHTYLSTV